MLKKLCSSGVGHGDVFWHGNLPGITINNLIYEIYF